MSKKYYIDHPTRDDERIEVPSSVSDKIIQDFMLKTFYWVVSTLSLMIGFLLGVISQ